MHFDRLRLLGLRGSDESEAPPRERTPRTARSTQLTIPRSAGRVADWRKTDLPGNCADLTGHLVPSDAAVPDLGQHQAARLAQRFGAAEQQVFPVRAIDLPRRAERRVADTPACAVQAVQGVVDWMHSSEENVPPPEPMVFPKSPEQPDGGIAPL